MSDLTLFLGDEAATRDLGARLGAILGRGDMICLTGPLGAGKTTLARAIIAAACGVEEAPSPTFSLVETYPCGQFTLWHFDLYRLEKAEDVWELGFEEALEDGVCLIEWPEKIAKFLPEHPLIIALSTEISEHKSKSSNDARRRAKIKASGAWPARLAALAPGMPGNA